jgi:hypothetical protein
LIGKERQNVPLIYHHQNRTAQLVEGKYTMLFLPVAASLCQQHMEVLVNPAQFFRKIQPQVFNHPSSFVEWTNKEQIEFPSLCRNQVSGIQPHPFSDRKIWGAPSFLISIFIHSGV